MSKPKRKGIAEYMRDVLIEHDSNRVMWGDIGFLDECARRCTHTTLMQRHPMNRHDRILNALDKSPLFEKGLVSAHAGVTIRKTGTGFWRKTLLRVFVLKEAKQSD